MGKNNIKPAEPLIPGLLDKFPVQKKNGEEHEKWAEDKYGTLDFILLPTLLFLGREAKAEEGQALEISDSLLALFLSSRKRKWNHDDLALARSYLKDFIIAESAKIKSDFRLRRLGSNRISPEDMLAMIARGRERLIQKGFKLDKLIFRLRKALPEPTIPLKFSRLGRYLLNGRSDQHWYRDTGKRMRTLFPGEDPGLIFDLFAATSIRASLRSNITKFFKALHQHKNGGDFKFLQATQFQLDHIKNGRPLGGG